jgi:DNA polymerase family A
MSFNWDALTPEEEAAVLKCADQSQMAKCPPGILGRYAALDCEATYIFYTQHILPLMQRFQVYADFHAKEFMTSEKLFVLQQLYGMRMERDALLKFQAELTVKTDEARTTFLRFPQVADGVAKINAQRLAELDAEKPAQQFLKGKPERPEPRKYTVKGEVTEGWKKWHQRSLEAQDAPLIPTQHFIRWETKRERLEAAIANYEALSAEEVKELGLFSLDSPLQLGQLFYDVLGYEILVWTRPGEGKEPKASTDSEAMKGFGEAGKLYTAYSEVSKLLEMVTGCLEHLVEHADGHPCGDSGWFLHPQVKVPGTITGRLGGSGGLNIQNVPKEQGYLECFVARPGCTLLEADAASLEPHVMTGRSLDPALMMVYGPNAPTNQDIYLMVGNSFPGIGNKFRACGYDPAKPTKEAVKACKAQHGKLRQASKQLHLSASYSAGAGKWKAILADEKVLMDNGKPYTIQAAKALHQAYWQLFAGVKKYERWLQNQVEKNGGYFLNGLGFPQGVADIKMKDIVNSDCQGTGHSILTLMLHLLVEELLGAGVQFKPWLSDMHDEFFFEIQEEDGEAACAASRRAEARLNAFLQGEVKIKFGPQCIKNWWLAKAE